MEWSRVKNILIVLLVLVNLFLFVVYLGTMRSDAQDEAELVSNTVAVMAKNGITVEEKIIPISSPILHPATANAESEILGTQVDGVRFSIKAEGDVSSLAKEAGLSHTDGVQTINNVPVCNATLSYDGEYFSGIAVKECETLENSAPIDVCGALVAAAEWLPKGEITAIKQAYFWSELGGSTVYLCPVWQVSCGEQVYYVNAMNGEAAKG